MPLGPSHTEPPTILYKFRLQSYDVRRRYGFPLNGKPAMRALDFDKKEKKREIKKRSAEDLSFNKGV